jgi:hypothetical protein
MTLYSASFTNANPGPALYALLLPHFTAQGYTEDDTVVIGARTHKILKSAAGNNSFGLQMFLDVSYPTTGVASGFMITPFEDYNAAGDLGIRGIYTSTSTVIDPGTFSRYGAASSALETNWANTVSHTGLMLTLSTAATTYWASVTPQRIALMLTSSPTHIAYAGFFTPTAEHDAWADTAMYPLIACRLLSGSNSNSSNTAGSSTAGVTRMPKVAAFDATAVGGPVGWADSVNVGANTHLGRVGGGIVGGAVSPFTGLAAIAPIPVTFGTASAPSNVTPWAAHVGNLDGVGTGYAVGATVRGDTVTIDGVTWHATTPVGNNSYFLKAA